MTVRFREKDGEWKKGANLRRAVADDIDGRSWSNRFAGSLFALDEGTEYEIELFLEDPDGGCAIENLTAKTRTTPSLSSNANEIHVTPDSIAAAISAAGPGDVVVLGVGTYGEIRVENDGTASELLGLRGTPGAIIEGDIRLDSRSYVLVEEVEVRGKIKFNNSKNISIVRSRIQTQANGIVTLNRSENAYIADNVVTGSSTWSEAALGVNGDNIGEGIAVTGPGHVIAHNRVSGFRDAISFLEGSEAVDQYSLDILNNEISEAADDGIEADFCEHNCRILDNRLTNTFIAISSQPGLGGPTYFIRNALYNVAFTAFKLQRGSVGDVLIHNTVVKNGDAFGVYTQDVFSRQYSRNNLWLGGPGAEYNGFSSGTGRVLQLTAAGAFFDIDFDGFGSTTGLFEGRLGSDSFTSLAQLQEVSGGSNLISVSLDIFEQEIKLPEAAMTIFDIPDMRLKEDSSPIDQGENLDGYGGCVRGDAPDLGAYEQGQTLPVYGPR